MEHFLLQLAKTSAIGGALIVLGFLLRPVLQKRFTAKVRYWLWLVLAAALIPAPFYTGSGAPVQITPPSEHVMVWTDKQAVMPNIVHKDIFVPEGTTPALSSVPSGTDLGTVLQPARRVIEVSTALFWVWVLGAAVFLTVQGVGYAKFRRLTRRWSEKPTDERCLAILREESERLGVSAPEMVICSAIPTPALTGLVRPTLLLPHEDYAETELRFILRHELTHLKRCDILYKLVLTLANAIHWFNPIVYLMLRAADEDIELSCDSAVTDGMEKAERTAYSETLLKSVREKGSAVALTTCFGSTVERLKRRLANVFDSSKKSRGVAVVVLAVCTVAALSAAIGFAPEKEKETEDPVKLSGEYADIEDYLMHKMPAIGSEVSYYPYSEDGTILKETTAKVLDRRLAWLEQTGTVSNLAPEGTLQSWKYNYLLQLDAPANGVRLVGGMYEKDGYYDLEGQGGHNLVVLQYADGSIDVLYDLHVNDNMDFYGYHLSYEEAIYDWYVRHYHLDWMKYPLYVDEFQLYEGVDVENSQWLYNSVPVHRYDGDGWYIYIPVSGAWEPGVGEPIWYSSYGTGSTIVVKSFDTGMAEARDYFEREGWTRGQGDVYLRDRDGQHAVVYLFENPNHLHYEVQTFWYDQSDGVNEWGWSAKTQVEGEQKILARMAQSFTVDERFSPALWTDPLYADALLNATTIGYTDETRSTPYFATDILANLTRDDTHEYPDGGAAFAVVDLDRDGTAEVVYRRSDYRGYIVMHLYYGGVCGHELNYREMISLKRDGSFCGSGGADDTIFNRIRFDGADMLLERDEYCVGTPQSESGSDNISQVSREKLDDIIFVFEQRPNVTWYDCTEENIRSVLGTNRGTRTVAFDDIMGLSGFYSETTDGAGFLTRRYYVPAVVGGYTPIGGSFGYTIDDHVVDLNGDGVTELVCNCQCGADGAQRVFVYQLDTREGHIEQGTYYPVYSKLTDYNDWGVNSSGEYYDADAGKFVLRYDTKSGGTAEKEFSYRELSFIRYTANDSPFPAPVLPGKTTTVPTESGAETNAPDNAMEIDGRPVTLSANGYIWYASASGWICREKDGKTEKLYELPVDFYTDARVIPSLTVENGYVTLSYHSGGGFMGSNRTFRFHDDGSYDELPANASTVMDGNLWVSADLSVPPHPGNLQISRDSGKTWASLGSADYTYCWYYEVREGSTSGMVNGRIELIGGHAYLLASRVSADDSAKIPYTAVCLIDLSTGGTRELTGPAKGFSIENGTLTYIALNGETHTCPLQ